MNKFNNIIKAAAILVLSGFASCVEMEDLQPGAVGYLAAPSLDVDVTVDNLVLTKAAPALPSVQEPDAEGVTFIVREKGSDVDLLGGKPWTSALTLDAGKIYVVEAYYGENGFEGPCFADSDEITIEPLVTATPDLTLTLSNALLCVTTDELDEHFTVTKIELVSGERSSVTKSEGNIIYTDSGEQIHTISGQVEDQWIWVPADKPLKVKVQGLNAAGNNASFEYDDLTPSAGTAYNLVCGRPAENQWPSIKWTEIPLSAGAFEGGLYFKAAVASNMSTENAKTLRYQIIGGDDSEWTDVTPADVEGYKYLSGLANGTEYRLRACVGNIFSAEQSFVPVTYASCLASDVTAAHNNAGNPSAMLESTAVEAAVKASLPAIIAELATSHTASVTFGNGRVKQTTLNVNESKQTLSNADGWPYLPQGSYAYTADVTLTLPGGRTHTAALPATVNVPAPEFSLALSAYTSYDKYAATNGITKDLNGTTGANNCDPATLYNAGGQWGISTAIMANANYAKTLVVNIDGNTDRTFDVTDNKYYENISSLAWQAHTLTVSVTFDGKTVSKTQTHHITGLPYVLTHPAQGWSIVENGAVTYTYFGDNYIFLTSDSSTGSVKTPDFHIPGNVDISVSTTFKRIRDGILTDWTFSVHTYDSNGNASQIDSHKGNGKNTTHTIGGDATFTPSCYNVLCRRYYWGGSGPDAQITDFTIDYR